MTLDRKADRYGEAECRMLVNAEIAHERISQVCADAHKGHLSIEAAADRISAASAALAGSADVMLICRGEPHVCQQEAIAAAEGRTDLLILEVERLRTGILKAQATLTKWAVAAGGHTPSAIVARQLRELVDYDGPALSDEDLDIALRSRPEAKP